MNWRFIKLEEKIAKEEDKKKSFNPENSSKILISKNAFDQKKNREYVGYVLVPPQKSMLIQPAAWSNTILFVFICVA